MAKGVIVQNSFNAGEISPLMEGRLDFERYKNSAYTLENWLIHTQGGISTRWGTRFIAACKVNATARLIPFVVDSTTWYLIELGSGSSGYIRIHRPTNSAPDDTPYDVTTALSLYSASQLFEIQFAQSGDVLYLVHPSFPVRKLSRLDPVGGTWEIKDVVFLPPPTFEKEQYPATTLATSALSGTGVKFYAGGAQFLAADVDTMILYQDARAIITAVDAGGHHFTADIIDAFPASRIVAGPGTISGAVTTITVSEPHGLTAANIGDVIVVADGAQAGQVRRIDGIPGLDTITIDSAFPGDPGGAAWSRGVHIDQNSWRMLGSPSAKLTSDKTGPVRAIATLTLDAAGWRVADVGRYVRAMGGTMVITAYTSPTQAKAQLLAPLSGAPSTAPWETLAGTWTLEDESWTETNGYPETVSFYEQRLFFGGSSAQPQTIWGSAIGDYENFAFGNLATDAVQYTIASNEINKLRWMSPSRVLLVGALSREYRASGGNDAITPANIDIRGETSYGSLKRRPVQHGHTTIFLQAAGRKVREMTYNFESDSYKADDLTVLNPQISTGGFEELAYSQEPDSRVFARRADGQIAVLTYEKAQEVMGWSRILTDGAFEAMCVMPPFSGSGEENLYVIADRNGQRNIERFDSSLCTDAAVTGSGPATVVSGLSHLNGKTVRMKGDGALYPDAVVAGGQVAFPESVDEYEVGLPFTSTLVTVRPELLVENQSTQGKPKRWSDLYVRVYNTTGLKVNGEQQFLRDTLDLMGAAPQPETADLRAGVLGVDGDARLTIVQDLPFKATVLMVVGNLSVGD